MKTLLTPAVYVLTTVRVLAAALIGYAMVTPAAAVLLEMQNRISGIDVRPFMTMVLIYILGLPPVGWVALRLVTVRPAWAAALLGQVLFLPLLIASNQPGGFHRPPWQYGLLGALAYGLSATIVIVIAVGVVARRLPDDGR